MPRSVLRVSTLLATLVATLLAARLAPAQTVDASVLGTVHDAGGAPIAEAAVVATNIATGVQWSVTTNATGSFAFLALPLGGPYTLAARKLGFRPETRAGYELTLGSRIVVDIALQPAPTEVQAIVVQGTDQDIRAATLGGNTVIGAEQLARIPALNRNFTDLASLAPTTGVQQSLMGQRWTSSDIRIDGAQARNMLRAGEFGAGPFTLSLESIREFQVSSTVYDVTQGREGGGGIRAATKSGTNVWTGSVFTYYQGSSIAAATDFRGLTRNQRQFTTVQWGGSVGGPLIKDKAHVFFSFDRQDSNQPLFTGVVNTPADEIAAGVPKDSLTRLMAILATKYGVDTTEAQIGRLDRQPVANTIFGRLDWALNERHHLTVTQNASYWDSPLSGGVDQPITLFEGRSDYKTLEAQSLATLASTFTSGLQNELQLGVGASHRKLTPNSLAPRGFVRIQSTLPNGSHGDIKVQFGGNRLAPDDSRELQLQLLDRAHLQRGNVLYTVGTDNTLSHMRTYIAESQSGLFEFNDLNSLNNLTVARYSRTLPLIEAQPTTHQSVLELGLFGQAEWRPTQTMTAMLGLRWDGTAFLTAPTYNHLVDSVLSERTDRKPSDWTKIEPRGQLVWDVGGMGRDVVRVGGGRFTSQAPYYVEHNQILNDGFRIADITRTGAAAPVPDYTSYRADPSTNPGLAVAGVTPPPYVNLVDADWRTPSIWKGSASYRRRLTSFLSLTGTFLYTATTSNYMYQDKNLVAAPAFAIDNEANRPVFVPAATIDAQGRTLNANALAHAQLGRVLELTNTGRGYQHAQIVEADITLPRGSSVYGSYTRNVARDNTTFGCCLARTSTTYTAIQGDPRDLSTSWGLSDTDFRDKVTVSGSAPAFWGVQVSARYVGQSGRPFSATVNGDINGDEATSNDLAFVFDPADPNTPAAVATSMNIVLNNPKNVARDYLLQNLGHIATRNGAFAPWSERVDARVTKTVGLRGARKAEIGLDIFNVANLINKKWGATYDLPVGISNQNPVIQRLPLLNVTGFSQITHRYTYTVNENFGVFQKTGNPYQIQLSVRYGF